MKRNLYNFSLLFASNMENLIAFMVQGFISERTLHFIEVFLGMVYLSAVLSNLFWFLKPLADRDEFDALSKWIEKRVDRVVDAAMKPFRWVKTKAGFAKPKTSSTNVSKGNVMKRTVMSALRMKSGASSPKEGEHNGELRMRHHRRDTIDRQSWS
jgi:hypothetical protein